MTYFGGGIRVGGGAPLALAFVVAVDDFSVVLFPADIAFPPLDIARCLSLSLFFTRALSPSLGVSLRLRRRRRTQKDTFLSSLSFFLSLSFSRERMQRTLFFFFEILFRTLLL